MKFNCNLTFFYFFLNAQHFERKIERKRHRLRERERERERDKKPKDRKKLNLVPNMLFYAFYAFYAKGKVKIETSLK
jgi:hypothetical protein